MDVFSLLSYINKVSLLAFVITTLVVVYQIYILKKEKTKEKTPSIPDFKERNNLNEVANFTSLPSSLTKKEVKSVNYSKLVFLIITLLTLIVIIFVVSLIKKKSTTTNQSLNNLPSKIITPVPVVTLPKSQPTVVAKTSPTIVVTPTPICTGQACLTPTEIPTVIPTVEPTEIVLVQAPSLTPESNPTVTIINAPQVLPETGSLGKGLLIMGVAISTIFLAFWF